MADMGKLDIVDSTWKYVFQIIQNGCKIVIGVINSEGKELCFYGVRFGSYDQKCMWNTGLLVALEGLR